MTLTKLFCYSWLYIRKEIFGTKKFQLFYYYFSYFMMMMMMMIIIIIED